jgi:serine protease AprX
MTATALAVVLAVATGLSLQYAPSASPAAGFSSGTPATQANVTPELSRLAVTDPSRQVEVIVRFADGVGPAQGRGLIAGVGGTTTDELRIIRGLGATMPAADAAALAADPAVRAVSLNAAVVDSAEELEGSSLDPPPAVPTTSPQYDDKLHHKLLETSFNQSIRADKVWKTGDTPITGKGIGVAVVDTGISGDHQDMAVGTTDPQSRVIASAVVNPDATHAEDGYGHGTHVAGLIAGNANVRPKTDRLRGAYVGSAPHANLISVKASDDHGDASLIDVIHALQFVVDHKAQYNIRVVNLSLNSTVAESYKTDPLDAAVEQAWFAGIVVVVAAGNRGTEADAVGYAPANDPYVLSVGAVDDQGTKDVKDDLLAEWSSRGQTQDGFVKPEILAPGAHMVSTLAAGSDIASLCPTCVTDGAYFKMGGTSMAAGVASGAIADLLQVRPSLTPDQVKSVLVNEARNVPGIGVEVAVDHAIQRSADPSTLGNVNAGLTPNQYIDPATGKIDFERARWSRARWSEATEALRARWSRARWSSFMCDCWDAGTEVAPEGVNANDPSVEADRARWSRARWSRARWSRARWSMSFTK